MLKKGFTLIELLVVIAIIGLLASIVFASVNASREKARLAGALSMAGNLFRTWGADALGAWDLSEGSGTTVGNASGGAAGTINGASWISDGPNGKAALSFGVGKNVNVGSVLTPQVVTVVGWIRTTSTLYQPIFSNRSRGVYFGTSVGKFYTIYDSVTSGPTTMTSSKSVNDGRWHFLVWSSDGFTEKMFIDGTFDSQQAQTRSGQSNGAYIGLDPTSPSDYITGDVSGVAVYPYSL